MQSKNTHQRFFAAATSSIVASLALAAPSSAQTWTQQYPPAFAQAVDVEALSGVNVWVANADGSLRHSTNAGTDWTTLSSGASSLKIVRFPSASLGLCAGAGIWRSSDAGQSWFSMSTAAIEDLVMVDTTTGWALTTGGHVLRSTNGGVNWSDLGAIPGASALLDLHFLAGGLGWASGAGGALFSTSNSGTSWTSVATGTAQAIESVHFVSANEGWITAGATIRRTMNGGAAWTAQSVPTSGILREVSFLTNLRGWAVGDSGVVLTTSTGGTTWNAGTGATGVNLLGVDFADFFNGFVVGQDGRVFRSGDGASTWTQVYGASSAALPVVFGLDAVDAQHAWAATGQNDVLRTTNGGQTWTAVSAGTNFQWRDVSFFDAQHGYICGKRQAFFPSMAWTHDGGQSWISVSYTMMLDFHDVEALGPNTALVAGDTFVFKTTDGGLSWPSVSPMPYGTYYGMDFVDANTGWIAGTEIFRTDDAGATWSHQATPSVSMFDVGFANASVGYCAGLSGQFMKTIDGGATWTTSAVPGFVGALMGLSVVDPQTVWITGVNGYVARTTDGGATWNSESPGLSTSAQPTAIKFVDANTGWLGGNFELALWARTNSTSGCATPIPYCVPKVNSSGGLCHLGSSGLPSFAQQNFSVTAEGALPNRSALFIYSNTGGDATPFFGGTRCVLPPLTRTPGFLTSPTGAGVLSIPVTPALVGTTRWYQLFYRDGLHPDGSGWGISDGIEVHFCN